jgi:hypothetical protein
VSRTEAVGEKSEAVSVKMEEASTMTKLSYKYLIYKIKKKTVRLEVIMQFRYFGIRQS